MRAAVLWVALALMATVLAGCGVGEQTAPKPDPAQFTPKPGGPSSGGPNSAPVTR